MRMFYIVVLLGMSLQMSEQLFFPDIAIHIRKAPVNEIGYKYAVHEGNNLLLMTFSLEAAQRHMKKLLQRDQVPYKQMQDRILNESANAVV